MGKKEVIDVEEIPIEFDTENEEVRENIRKLLEAAAKRKREMKDEFLKHIRTAGSALEIAHRQIFEQGLEVPEEVKDLLVSAMRALDKLEENFYALSPNLGFEGGKKGR